jgi:hypothetical protein
LILRENQSRNYYSKKRRTRICSTRTARRTPQVNTKNPTPTQNNHAVASSPSVLAAAETDAEEEVVSDEKFGGPGSEEGVVVIVVVAEPELAFRTSVIEDVVPDVSTVRVGVSFASPSPSPSPSPPPPDPSVTG